MAEPKTTRAPRCRTKDRTRLQTYNGLLVLGAPAFLTLKIMRWFRRHEDYEFSLDRWHTPPLPKSTSEHPPGEVRVVLVALSWGEVPMMDRISRALEERSPEVEIIWAIRSRAARELAAKRFPDRVLVPMPFDFLPAVRSWLDVVQPQLLIVVEKFWWPNLVWQARCDGVRNVLVNGRSRGRKAFRYRVLTKYHRWILRAFDLLMFGDEQQVRRVADVLPSTARVIATGSIKFALDEIKPPPEANAVDAWIHARAKDAEGKSLPIFAAGSTHEVDEDWLLEVWGRLQDKVPCVLLVAPRELKRADEVAARLEATGAVVSRRTAPVPGARILLLDTIGELSYVYRWASAAYVGGAITGRGHNIVEPLAWGVPVSFGPNRGDFEEVQKSAERYGVATRLHAVDNLAAYWEGAIMGSGAFVDTPRRSRELLDAKRGAFALTVEAILTEVQAVLAARGGKRILK